MVHFIEAIKSYGYVSFRYLVVKKDFGRPKPSDFDIRTSKVNYQKYLHRTIQIL